MTKVESNGHSVLVTVDEVRELVAQHLADGAAQTARDEETGRKAVAAHLAKTAKEEADIKRYREEGRQALLAEQKAAKAKAEAEAQQARDKDRRASENARKARKQASDDLLDLEVKRSTAWGQVYASTHSITTAENRSALVEAATNLGVARSTAEQMGLAINEVAIESRDPDILRHYKLIRDEERANVPAPEGFRVVVVPDEFPRPIAEVPAPIQSTRRKRVLRKG